MANSKLKNTQLAKLRTFQPGMNVEKFLSEEWRQVVKALEQSFVNSQSSPVFVASYDAAVVGVVPLQANINAFTLDGGSVKNFGFYPESSGKYLIDVSMTVVTATGLNDHYVDINVYNFNNDLLGNATGQKSGVAGQFKFAVQNAFVTDLTPEYGVYFKLTQTNSAAPCDTKKFNCKIYKIS